MAHADDCSHYDVATYPNLFILGTSGEKFTVGTETHAANIKIALFTRSFVNKNATLFEFVPLKLTLTGIDTYHVLAPVLVSYICAVRLHPVARYLPSAENRTQQTTLTNIV